MENLAHAIYSASFLTLITLGKDMFLKQQSDLKKHALIFLATFAFCYSVTGEATESEKIYIDTNDLSEDVDAFHIHLGHNVWIETNAVHKDCTGTFTYQCNVMHRNAQYEQKWKCPYCYHYWPMGSSCKNPNCPSKFKGI